MKKLFTLAIIAMIATLTFAQAPIKMKVNPVTSEMKKQAGLVSSKMVQGKRQFKMSADKIRKPFMLDAAKIAKATAGKQMRAKAYAEAANIQIAVSNVASTSVNLSFTPADEEAYFNMGVIEAAEFAEVTEADIIATATEDLDFMVQIYAMFGLEATYEDFVYSGQMSGPYNSLSPDTEYVVYAYYLDVETGQATSGLATATFKTEAVKNSDNVITLTYNKEKNVINIKTTNNDPYIFFMETQEDYNYYQDEVSDEAVQAELEDWIYTFDQYDMTEELILTGDQEIDANEFWLYWISNDDMETDDYIAFAAPYDALINGAVAYTQFHYDAPEIIQSGEKTLHIVKPEWTDAVAEQGWWQIIGETADGAYTVSLSNNYTEEAIGTYEIADMDKDYTFVKNMDADETVKFADITVVVAKNEEGMIVVSAEGLGKDGIKYTLTFDAVDPNVVKGEPYDMEEGTVTASFETADIQTLEIEKEEGYAYVRCIKDNEMLAVFFYIEDELAAGTYEVNDSYEVGSVQSCLVADGSVYPSFYATTDEQGYLNVPFYYFTTGTVKVAYDEAANLVLEANVVNTWGVEGTFYVNVPVSAIKHVTATEAVQKQLINNQIVIKKNGKNYNVAGVEMK